VSIDPLSNVTQLIEALRQQINATKAGAPAAAQSVRQSAGAAVQAERKTKRSLDLKSLERKLQARIGKLQRQEGTSFEALTRIFIESILLWEFGDELSQDPRFHQMLDEIVETVAQDDELKEQFRSLFSKMKD
jgi:hypothetical protein